MWFVVLENYRAESGVGRAAVGRPFDGIDGFDAGNELWRRGVEANLEELEFSLVEIVVVAADCAAIGEGAAGREDEIGTAVNCCK